jgi:hypothetical protein
MFDTIPAIGQGKEPVERPIKTRSEQAVKDDRLLALDAAAITITTEVAQQYAQYLELAGIAKLTSEANCWEDGTSSSVASFVVGYTSPAY